MKKTCQISRAGKNALIVAYAQALQDYKDGSVENNQDLSNDVANFITREQNVTDLLDSYIFIKDRQFASAHLNLGDGKYRLNPDPQAQAMANTYKMLGKVCEINLGTLVQEASPAKRCAIRDDMRDKLNLLYQCENAFCQSKDKYHKDQARLRTAAVQSLFTGVERYIKRHQMPDDTYERE